MEMLEIYNILSGVLNEDIAELIIKKLCILTMTSHISSKGINPNILFKALKYHNCVISGSFPLLCLLGLPIENSDIDIYGQYKPEDDILGKKYHSEYPIHKFEELLNNIIPTTLDYINPVAECGEYSQIPDIKYTRSYLHDPVHSGKLFQFISVNVNPYKFIKDTFDLSFCKIVFNGEDLSVFNFKDILQMRGKLDITVDKGTLEMLKYTYDNPMLTSDPSEVLSFYPITGGYGCGIRITSKSHVLSEHLFVSYLGGNAYTEKDRDEQRLASIIDSKQGEHARIALTALRIIKYKKRGFIISFES